MGNFCKAYSLNRLRGFDAWRERTENAREDRQGERQEGGAALALGSEDFLYLHENFVVTDGVFIEAHVIFDKVTPEWIVFCQNTLGFEAPKDEEGDPKITHA
ncbi:MAG: hypothetical protein WCF57_00595 [Pyrinomonadaceae bacterium]